MEGVGSRICVEWSIQHALGIMQHLQAVFSLQEMMALPPTHQPLGSELVAEGLYRNSIGLAMALWLLPSAESLWPVWALAQMSARAFVPPKPKDETPA